MRETTQRSQNTCRWVSSNMGSYGIPPRKAWAAAQAMEFYAELTGDSAGIERVDGQAGAPFHGCSGWRMTYSPIISHRH